MAYQPVDLYVNDSTVSKNPVEGVVVRVYSQDGKMFFTQVATDVGGHAGFSLPEDTTFQLRFYKFAVSFQNPLLIHVNTDPLTNVFDVPAVLLTPPIAADGRLCVAYGHFRRPDGSVAPHVDIHFIPRFKPLLLDGSAIMTERLEVRTGDDGYVQVNLVRNGHYDVTVQGLEDMQRKIRVPDLPNVNLPDLLFPVVKSVTFDPPGPYTVAVGAELIVTATILISDGNQADKDDTVVFWSSSDTAVLAVLVAAGNKLTLRGIGAGTANLVGVRADQTIVHIPDDGISGVPQPVIVT